MKTCLSISLCVCLRHLLSSLQGGCLTQVTISVFAFAYTMAAAAKSISCGPAQCFYRVAVAKCKNGCVYDCFGVKQHLGVPALGWATVSCCSSNSWISSVMGLTPGSKQSDIPEQRSKVGILISAGITTRVQVQILLDPKVSTLNQCVDSSSCKREVIKLLVSPQGLQVQILV